MREQKYRYILVYFHVEQYYNNFMWKITDFSLMILILDIEKVLKNYYKQYRYKFIEKF